MTIVPAKYSRLYVAFCAIFALFGTSITIVGATLPTILGDFGWNYGTAGLVMAAGAIGYFLSTFVAGRVLGRLGARNSIAIGLVLDTVGLAFFAAGPSPLLNLLLYFAVGLGQGFIEVTINWAVLRMGEPEPGEPAVSASHAGRAMSLMHGTFAIGAVAGPFVLGWLLEARLPWATLYRGMAGLFGILLATSFILPMHLLKRETRSEAARTGGAGRIRRDAEGRLRGGISSSPAYWLGFFSLLLYVGVELGISNWSAEYFVSVFGSSPATGSFMVSLFWTGLLAGRFGIPVLSRNVRQEAILVAISILLVVSSALLALFGFFGPAFRIPAYILIFLAGLGCSCIYPIVVSIAGETFPRAQAQAISFASTGGGLGSFVFPYLMSLISGRFGIRYGFAVYAFFAVISLLSCRALIASSKREREART